MLFKTSKFLFFVIVICCSELSFGQSLVQKALNETKSFSDKTRQEYQSLIDVCNSDSNKDKPVELSTAGIGGIPITMAADGVSKFLVKRTKQELSMTVFSKLQSTLDSISYLQEMLPHVRGKLNNIESDIYNYQLFIHGLRDAFMRDLEQLPINLHTYLLKDSTIVRDEVKRLSIVDALYLGQQVLNMHASKGNERDYVKVIHDFIESKSYIMKSEDPRLSSAQSMLNTTYVMLQAILEDGKSVDIDSFREVMHNDSSRLILFGLVHRQACLRGSHKDMPKLDVMEARLTRLLGLVKELEQLVATSKDYIERTKSSPPYETYLRYFTTVSSIISIGAESRLSDSATPVFFPLLDAGGQLVLKLHEQRYSSAITDLMDFTRLVFGEDKQWIDKAMHYLYFAATVAEADNSDQIAEAIESFVLPVGSSIIKRTSNFSISLNAYTGLSTGVEFPMNEMYENSGMIGISAPIGLSANWGYGWKGEPNRGTFNIFMSIIDLGAVFAYRFENDTTASLPEVTLGNIFAPGLFFESSVFNSPITVGFGGQFSPNVREIVTEQGIASTKESVEAIRIVGTIKVDLPLLFIKRNRYKK